MEAAEAAVDQDLRSRFLEAMSHAACTVSIVTTEGPAGRAGVTVSAMASVSADTPKPTLLVCVHHLSPAATAITANRVLCVNVLRDDQTYISDTFAGRYKDRFADKFDCTEWVPCASGAPRVADPLVAFDCRLSSGERVGTHHVFVCDVEDIVIGSRGSPLIYANRAYGTPSRIESVTGPLADAELARDRLKVGCFHSFAPYVLPRLIRRLTDEVEATAVHLVEGDQRRLQESLFAGETEIALLYDLDLAEGLDTIPLAETSPYVLLPEGHPLARRESIGPADLAAEPMILLSTPPSGEFFLSLMRDAGVEPRVAYRTGSFEVVRGMVGHGLGYSLLVTKPAANMTYDGMALVTRPLDHVSRDGPIVLAHVAGSSLSPAAERFARLCKEAFARTYDGR